MLCVYDIYVTSTEANKKNIEKKETFGICKDAKTAGLLFNFRYFLQLPDHGSKQRETKKSRAIDKQFCSISCETKINANSFFD